MSRIGSAVLAVAATSCSLAGLSIAVVPTAASAAPPAVAVEASSLLYTVQNGDYLFGIAVKLNVKVSDLLAVNELTITTAIHPGQQLAVPVGGTLPVASAGPSPTPAANPAPAAGSPVPAGATTYTVKNGDFLFRIATNNGVTFSALLAANKITAATPIHPGSTLVIPPATLPIPTSGPGITPAPAAPQVASPGPSPAPAPAVGSTTYTVKNGDFLIGIATSNGVTLKALLAANSMNVASAIFPGTTLTVPPATLPIPTPPAPAAPAAPTPSGAPSPQQNSIATVLAFLQGELGKPYLFNSAGPDAYDCSGLVVAAYKQIGINLPHQSLLQSQKGTNVDWHVADIQAGDLIFMIGTGKTYISHVGIAISSTQWIQSARAGDVVKISSIPSDERIEAVRRIVN